MIKFSFEMLKNTWLGGFAARWEISGSKKNKNDNNNNNVQKIRNHIQ